MNIIGIDLTPGATCDDCKLPCKTRYVLAGEAHYMNNQNAVYALGADCASEYIGMRLPTFKMYAAAFAEANSLKVKGWTQSDFAQALKELLAN